MFEKVGLKNFGPIAELNWANLGKINLVIGENGSGKTFLLKALYCAVRTLEEYRRGNVQRTDADILVEKLRWTFETEKIGDLVTKGGDTPLEFSSIFEGRAFYYTFGKDTSRQISSIRNNTDPRSSNSIFLPAKEVLSLHRLILKSREGDQIFGFDDTYLDLARALSQIPTVGRNYDAFAVARRALSGIVHGQVVYDEAANVWLYKQGNQKFAIGLTAEGVKKISILDMLLRNSYLTPESLIFIDEPESALHPRAISDFLDIIADLSTNGIQFFLASHSYFVIKKLMLIAESKGISIPVISANPSGWVSADLKEGMPGNPIIDESIRLYEQEVDLVLP